MRINLGTVTVDDEDVQALMRALRLTTKLEVRRWLLESAVTGLLADIERVIRMFEIGKDYE